MRVEKNKIIFEENDLKTLSRFKEMNEIANKLKEYNKKANILKKSAFSEIELFLEQNNIKWTNLMFNDEDNSVSINNERNKSNDTNLDDIIGKILGI